MQTPVSKTPAPTRPSWSGRLVDPRGGRKTSSSSSSSTSSPQIRTASTARIADKGPSAGANTINEKKVPSVGANTINTKKVPSVGANTINKDVNDVIFKGTFDVDNEKKKMDQAVNLTKQLLQKNIEINQGLFVNLARVEEQLADRTKQLEDVTKREAAANLETAEERKKTAAERSAKEKAQKALNEQLKVVVELNNEKTEYMRKSSDKMHEMNCQLVLAIEKFEAEKKKLVADHTKALSDKDVAMQLLCDENATLKTFRFDASAKIGELQKALERHESEIDLKKKSNESFAMMMGTALGSHSDAAVLWRTFEQAYHVQFAKHVYGSPRKREHSPDDPPTKTPPPSASPSEASCSSTQDGEKDHHQRKRHRHE